MTSNLNLRLTVNDVMPTSLYGHNVYQLAINCIFLTITFETRILRAVSQDGSIPFTKPVKYYSSLVLPHFLHKGTEFGVLHVGKDLQSVQMLTSL